MPASPPQAVRASLAQLEQAVAEGRRSPGVTSSACRFHRRARCRRRARAVRRPLAGGAGRASHLDPSHRERPARGGRGAARPRPGGPALRSGGIARGRGPAAGRRAARETRGPAVPREPAGACLRPAGAGPRRAAAPGPGCGRACRRPELPAKSARSRIESRAGPRTRSAAPALRAAGRALLERAGLDERVAVVSAAEAFAGTQPPSCAWSRSRTWRVSPFG